MKKLNILFGTIVISLLAACASPEERSKNDIDTTQEYTASDTAGTDTVTQTGSMSGDNGAGADTTDVNKQKATRQSGDH
ncbi:MAG: hypothetical protein EOO92_20580 [Pedobacter sp.]|nr:MAG: hypothetical protein EOO92_20580 [Pedobacter sp.]